MLEAFLDETWPGMMGHCGEPRVGPGSCSRLSERFQAEGRNLFWAPSGWVRTPGKRTEGWVGLRTWSLCQTDLCRGPSSTVSFSSSGWGSALSQAPFHACGIQWPRERGGSCPPGVYFSVGKPRINPYSTTEWVTQQLKQGD